MKTNSKNLWEIFAKRSTKNPISLLAIAILLLSSLCSYSQSAPRLSFKNSTLDSGTAAADGAVYRFPTVTAGVDALVKINGRSSTNVELNDIDITGTGYDSAFQPLVNYKNGSGIKNNVTTDWYMEFQITFVKAGTKIPTPVTSFNATGLDDDGNSSLHEYLSFYGLSTSTLENPTAITASTIMSGSTAVGKRFDGATTDYSGIDVTQTTAMVTTTYLNTSSFTLRTGGKALGPINISNNGRQYSIWFKSFTYNAPVVSTLPITLSSFTGQLNNSVHKVNLNWTTSSEMNASHFVVQRSTDGKNFDDEGMVFSQEGNSNLDRLYSFNDDVSGLNTGIIYYRLNMVDIDGHSKYSEIVVVRVSSDQQDTKMIVFPNPATSIVNITIPQSWQNMQVSYNIYNLNGNLIKSFLKSNAGQTETFSIAGYALGNYIVKVSNGNNTSVTQFVKIK